MIDWENALRLINALGCVVALWFLSTASFRQWTDWNEKTRNHWWALFGWVFLGLEGTVENLVQSNPPGARIIVQTLVLAWTIRALTARQELKAQSSIPWKGNKE